MKKNLFLIAGLCLAILPVFSKAGNIPEGGSRVETAAPTAPAPFRFTAASARVNPATAGIVTDERLGEGKGVSLKSGIQPAIDSGRVDADVVFDVKLPAPGRYLMHTFAVTDEEGAEMMKKAKTKFESLYIKIQIDENRPTKRVVYVPWDVKRQESGKFEFSGRDQQLKIWLPRGVRLEYIELKPYVAPKIPEGAVNYKPAVTPPASHPRLWVNRQTLPALKAGLDSPEHRDAWKKVEKAAAESYDFKFEPNQEVSFDPKLEKAAEAKAFYYLMTGDQKTGREAVTLIRNYISLVEFGNLLDITREIGRAIYTTSLVYDWCYDLLSTEDKLSLQKHLMRLSDDMEIGWPPFLTSIVNGHGNEAQVCRDLLSMSIALYNEDPLPYQYTSYVVLETLVPLRKFEYQSPRHNQGVSYGAYRFAWDMHAALLFERMLGKPVFDDNIKRVPEYFQYMRLPDGQMLRDGDGFGTGKPGEVFYWKAPLTMLLCYAYSKDPLIKGEFVRQGGLPADPVLFLLLNDPAVKANEDVTSLPLTKDFGPVLGSMIARTGWNIGMDSPDVVAEVKGGGYHFGNHQHSDAGSVQLYYRGLQFGDLGVYKFYGTPYDFSFNKRSIAHSMVLVEDPSEEIPRSQDIDGGTRFNQRYPKTAEEVTTDPWYKNGEVLAADFGPSKQKPAFSYFSVDLASAYTKKVEKFNRSFVFLNLESTDIPAAIVMADDITASNPAFKKYWQINALNEPVINEKGFVLHSEREGKKGFTYAEMLVPNPQERTISVKSGGEANSSLVKKVQAPDVNLPEIKGHRIMVSPLKAAARDHFLTVFQVTADGVKPMPVQHLSTEVSDVVVLGDRLVSVSRTGGLIAEKFTLKVPGKAGVQAVLTGMKAGKWTVSGGKPRTNLKLTVEEGRHTLYFEGRKGAYVIAPAED
ncbi:heparinase II/III family protein [Ravibacter arvi]|uniref:Heparinase II/III family protein n=1 Tax=Ravibacter arvi TaxID=2051041 RepID=A0ABP8M2E8_9BACT